MEEIANRFYLTFVYDDRYLYYVEGLKTTLLLTFSSFLLGIVFAVLLVMASRSSNKALRALSAGLSYFLVEIPTMVLLMVMVYIVFGATAVSVLWIVIIGLTLKAGAYLAEIFRSALDTVDVGEQEAALTLSMTKWQAFRYVVLPQAAAAALPLCENQFIVTMQETSIVGYLAIMDLTRAYTVVASRSMDAIVGLTSVTAIYFVVGGLAKWLMGLAVRNREGVAA